MATPGPHAPLSLGASSAAGGAVLWALALIVLVLGAAVAVFFIRRRVLDDAGDSGADALDLGALAEMRRDGRLTEEEYRAAREQVIRMYTGGDGDGGGADGGSPGDPGDEPR